MRRQDVPPDLRGRRDHDRFLVAISAVFGGVQRARGLFRPKLPMVRPVSRDLALVVREVRTVADDVVALTLGAVDDAPLPSWQPGCHLDVRLPSGRRRQYSLCGDPADRRAYRIATRLIPDGGGGSAEIHGLRPGDRLTVQGPRNAFPFLARERYLFLAGGIGITPILPMVKAAAGTDWRLVYTGRTRAAMPFLDELPADRVTIRTDDADGPPNAADWLRHVAPGTAIYCCGPAPMLAAVRAASAAHELHYERFAPPPVVDGKPFTVELARSGLTVEVPATRSALAAVQDHLPDVPYSCRQGFCGTCRVTVLSGEVDRRTGDALDGTMLICVSRAADCHLRLDL